MRTNRCWIVLAAVTAIAFLAQTDAHATSLLLDDPNDGIPALVINDGGLYDVNPAVGAVTFVGSVGHWSMNVTTGLSYPLQGSPAVPYLDLNSVDSTTATLGNDGGELYVALTQTDFRSPIPGALTFQVGGTTQGQIRFGFAVSDSNELFGYDSFQAYAPPDHSTYFGPGAYSLSQAYAPPAVLDTYSMTIMADIVHTGLQTTSFDAQVTAVPEPSTLILFGFGLVGMALLRKKGRG